MQEETLRQSIARNLTFYRKLAGHTQAELAEQLNYSDKSVSKWERGEGVPDIYVLQQIAELYRITVNDLIST
ncbi:MAG: helix-turn-helix transcriptional regulator, partial [Clostridia bacterium]|nr:helix-turn-helix transcriptional regulator [Clostridia bacterium]